jgi:hypothetical protein
MKIGVRIGGEIKKYFDRVDDKLDVLMLTMRGEKVTESRDSWGND